MLSEIQSRIKGGLLTPETGTTAPFGHGSVARRAGVAMRGWAV